VDEVASVSTGEQKPTSEPKPKPRSKRRSGVEGTKKYEMTLGFDLPDGITKDVIFSERPLGLRFTASVPLTVTDVCPSGKAFDHGVENGWKLRSIDGSDLTGKPSEMIIAAFCKKASNLPLVYL